MTTGFAYVLLFAALAFGVLSQILIKWQVSYAPSIPPGWMERALFVIELLIRPWMIVALISTFIGGVCWMMTLYKLPLNVAFPFLALIYPLMIGASYLVFGEQLNQYKIIGVMVIFVGVILAAKTG